MVDSTGQNCSWERVQEVRLQETPWFNADALAQKWLKRLMEARCMKSCSEVDKKAYQDARNIYFLKLKKAKCLYLNTAVEEAQGNQKKIFGLLDSLTKEPRGYLRPSGSEASLAEGFAGFFQEKMKVYVNLSMLQMGFKCLLPTKPSTRDVFL